MIVIGSIVFARRMTAPDLHIEATPSGAATPTVERAAGETVSPAREQPFAGQGTWTMSSLPDCFREVERSRGPVAMMRPRFPSESTRVKPAGVVRRGNCTIVVGEHDLWIARGADRLRVPPEARLYQDQGRLTLVVIGPKQAEIRVY
ncbi:MAG: hypothetical protein NVSMB64_09430 [Candidatus Velthaea sp.]